MCIYIYICMHVYIHRRVTRVTARRAAGKATVFPATACVVCWRGALLASGLRSVICVSPVPTGCVPVFRDRRCCAVVPLSVRLKRESELQAFSCVLLLETHRPAGRELRMLGAVATHS